MDWKEQFQALGLHKGVSQLKTRPARRWGPAIEEVVAGEVLRTPWGECFLAGARYEPSYTHGHWPLGLFLAQRPDTLARLAQNAAFAGVELTRIAFVDVETTGLAGGTGTYCFLIGLGHFESDGSFSLHQFFMRDFGEEPAQLATLSDSLARFEALVSFNGRAFDLPLIQTRFALARLPFPLPGAPHLDLLFPARRIWQHVLPSCALSSIEYHVLGVQRTSEEVPSYLIPTLYFEYLRSGDARPMAGVFYHNAQDILSLVMLTAWLGRAVERPLEWSITPLEMLGMARLYEDAGMMEECVRLYSAALQGPLPADREGHALCRLSYLFKRIGRREEAVRLWHRLSESEHASLYPYIELAKHYEWMVGDIASAIHWAERAKKLASRWPPSPERHRAMAELEHRLARLRHKLNRRPSADASEADAGEDELS